MFFHVECTLDSLNAYRQKLLNARKNSILKKISFPFCTASFTASE